MNTPEAAVTAFLTGWKRRRWHDMIRACQTSRRLRGRVTEQTLRQTFAPFRMSSFVIDGPPVPVSDPAIGVTRSGQRLALTPEAVDVHATLRVNVGRGVINRPAVIRVIREGEDGMPLIDLPGGSWGVNELSAVRQE